MAKAKTDPQSENSDKPKEAAKPKEPAEPPKDLPPVLLDNRRGGAYQGAWAKSTDQKVGGGVKRVITHTVVVRPGPNLVAGHDYAKIEKNPGFSGRVEAGEIKVHLGGWSSLDRRQKEDLIRRATDIPTLVALRDTDMEPNYDLHDAIEKRLALITDGGDGSSPLGVPEILASKMQRRNRNRG